jgi:hypothetical protein
VPLLTHVVSRPKTPAYHVDSKEIEHPFCVSMCFRAGETLKALHGAYLPWVVILNVRRALYLESNAASLNRFLDDDGNDRKAG